METAEFIAELIIAGAIGFALSMAIIWLFGEDW